MLSFGKSREDMIMALYSFSLNHQLFMDDVSNTFVGFSLFTKCTNIRGFTRLDSGLKNLRFHEAMALHPYHFWKPPERHHQGSVEL